MPATVARRYFRTTIDHDAIRALGVNEVYMLKLPRGITAWDAELWQKGACVTAHRHHGAGNYRCHRIGRTHLIVRRTA